LAPRFITHRAIQATLKKNGLLWSQIGAGPEGPLNTGGFMQFHLNGFEPGDPEISDPAQRHPSSGCSDAVPEQVDVLIVGCGPAGLTLAAQLSAFPDIKTCIIEQKSGPLLRGQADGIACRTMEMFEAFGFSERVLKEACWINETTFWKPDARQRENITRNGWVQDTEDGLSEFPHVVLNQARVHDFYLDVMRKSPARLEPHYARRLLDLQVDPKAGAGDNADPHAVTVRLERLDPAHEGQIETIKARYVVGCDGARSTVRKSIGRTLLGDSANHAWGVMDVLAVTDFPDIRCKSLIQSANDGSIIVIPREGGYLVRLYVEQAVTMEWPMMASQTVPRPGRSVRDLLESEIAGSRAHQCYGKQGHQHRGGDKEEHARHPGMLQNKSNHEAGEDRRKSAPRINEADGPRADAGRKQLLLIGVVGVGHHVVAKRQARSEEHDGHGAAGLTKGQAAHDDGQRHNNEHVFALEPVGDQQTEQRPDRRGQCDQRGIEQAIGDRDALLD